jgi:hypothetical protein
MDRLHKSVAIAYVVAIVVIFLCWAGGAYARWKSEYANAPQAVQNWYQSRKLTEAARKRFAFDSCCDGSDKVNTQFKANSFNGDDEWYYLKDGQWVEVPKDIIWWDKHSPTGEAVMFALEGKPTCFFPPEGGL